jgi:hypothetical protein
VAPGDTLDPQLFQPELRRGLSHDAFRQNRGDWKTLRSGGETH